MSRPEWCKRAMEAIDAFLVEEGEEVGEMLPDDQLLIQLWDDGMTVHLNERVGGNYVGEYRLLADSSVLDMEGGFLVLSDGAVTYLADEEVMALLKERP